MEPPQYQSAADIQYAHPQHQQPQQQQQQSQPWNSSANLLQPVHPQSAFPSPSASPSSLTDQPYPSYHQPYHSHSHSTAADRASSTSLSLNISALTVTSPTNLSPITPSTHPSSTTAVSPITPISPGQPGINSTTGPSHIHHHPAVHPFQFVPPPLDHRYEDPSSNTMHYDYPGRRLTSSRSSSSDEKSIPRKRSFTAGGVANTMLEEHIYEASDMDVHTPGGSVYDDLEMSYGNAVNGSPVDAGSNSGGEQDDPMKPSGTQLSHSGIIGKPITTNNFVTKLYQMISDPKSTQFINWTDLGTSFVVSNVAEFSRTILGSHFKHNNFSSFVRQLNMYGFHKINRTPRSQRSSSDVQTWEFSHHKFLRGRPDLLEEIKRKTMDPDPSLTNLKQRLELPGEIVVQLSAMKDENKRIRRELEWERRKFGRLAGVVKVMWDVVDKVLPAGLHVPFPTDLLDPNANNSNPNILVTGPGSSVSASASPAPPSSSSSATSNVPASSLPSLSLPSVNNHSYSLSPASSPTTGDFPSHSSSSHGGHSHSLSRQTSFQQTHQQQSNSNTNYDPCNGRYDSALSTPLPPSPSPAGSQQMEERTKRQRISPVEPPSTVPLSGNSSRKVSRARSDSAPMGVGVGLGIAGGGFFSSTNSSGANVNGGFSYSGISAGGRARGLSSAGGGGRGKGSTTGF